jgi:hypothetical protein
MLCCLDGIMFTIGRQSRRLITSVSRSNHLAVAAVTAVTSNHLAVAMSRAPCIVNEHIFSLKICRFAATHDLPLFYENFSFGGDAQVPNYTINLIFFT